MNRAFIALCFAWVAVATSLASGATRSLPAFFNPGQPFVVTIATAPASGTQVQAFEEAPPAGWTIAFISHGGTLDPISGAIKWGPFLDSNSRSLTFQITPPADIVGAHPFAGVANFDSTSLPISGPDFASRFPGSIQRSSVTNYLPGAPLFISIEVAPASDVRAWAAEEAVPALWVVTSVSENGVHDLANNRIKWGPFFDAAPRVLTYTIRPPASARAGVQMAASVQLNHALLTSVISVPIKPSSFSRTAPAAYIPNETFTVLLNATPAPYVQTFALEEQIPAGWSPAAISAGGVWDVANRKIKWGPFFAPAGEFEYQLTPSENASAPLALSATALFDNISQTSAQTISRHLTNAQSSIVRTLPANYRPGQGIELSLKAGAADTVRVYGIEEAVPAGWTVGAISHGGFFDAQNREVKWGPFFDANPRTLTCQLTPSANAFGAVAFQGAGLFDAEVVDASGPTQLLHLPPTAVRALPARYNSAEAISVSVSATPVPGVVTYAIEEEVPAGWTVSGISDGGAFDAANKKIKWGPFLDRSIRALTYTATPTAASPTNHFSGSAVFNSDSVVITGPETIAQNTSPTAVADQFNRPLSATFKISVFQLLANDTDVDGDLLQVAAVSSASENGGAIAMEWPWIYYTPPPGSNTLDRFSYTVRDAFNASANATVTLQPMPPNNGASQNIISIEPLTGGAVRLRFSGVPSFAYHIETSQDLAAWQPAADRVANALGFFEFTDEEAASFPARYYRTLWP